MIYKKKRLNGDIFAKLPTPSRGGPKPYTSSPPPPAPVQDCALVMPFRPCPSRGLCMPLLSNILSSYKKTVKSKLIYPFVENKPYLAFYFVLPKLIYNIVLILLQVNNNGYLTFDEPLSQPTSSYLQSKLNRDFIAPLWTDMDSTVSGTISYCQVASGRLLLAASNNINQYFPNLNFNASWLFIATWDKVPYYNNSQSVRYLFSVITHIW